MNLLFIVLVLALATVFLGGLVVLFSPLVQAMVVALTLGGLYVMVKRAESES